MQRLRERKAERVQQTQRGFRHASDGWHSGSLANCRGLGDAIPTVPSISIQSKYSHLVVQFYYTAPLDRQADRLPSDNSQHIVLSVQNYSSVLVYDPLYVNGQ